MFSRFFKQLSPAKKIAFLAVFLALGVASNFLSIDLNPSNKLAFTYTVCFATAFLLGGVPAFAVGFLGDAIGFLLAPSGVFWLFGLTLGLFGLIVGFLLHLNVWEDRKWGTFAKAAISLLVAYLLITLAVNSVVNYYYVKIFVWQGEAKKTFFVWLGGRIALQSLVYFANVALCMLLVPLLNRMTLLFGGKKREENQAA